MAPLNADMSLMGGGVVTAHPHDVCVPGLRSWGLDGLPGPKHLRDKEGGCGVQHDHVSSCPALMPLPCRWRPWTQTLQRFRKGL